MVLELCPAYGRTYATQEAILADWLAGKDFQICAPLGGPYLSIRDLALLREEGYTAVSIWNGQRNTAGTWIRVELQMTCH